MINKFESIEKLNNYYLDLLNTIDTNGLSLDPDFESEMRKTVLNTYKKDASLLVYNDDYDLSLTKKKLELERTRSKKEYKLEIKKEKGLLNLEIRAKDRAVKKELKEERQRLFPSFFSLRPQSRQDKKNVKE